jgi:hypothetical protein
MSRCNLLYIKLAITKVIISSFVTCQWDILKQEIIFGWWARLIWSLSDQPSILLWHQLCHESSKFQVRSPKETMFNEFSLQPLYSHVDILCYGCIVAHG